jgi:hypothetical protein
LLDCALGDEAMAGQADNLWDALFGELGRAISDVRQKVAVEPWFGRGADTRAMGATRSVAEELGWVRSDRAIDADTAHDLSVLREMGHDIDR